MTHSNFKPRKPGLIDKQIRTAKNLRHCANYDAHADVRMDLMVGIYGGKPRSEIGTMILKEMDVEYAVDCQGMLLAYSDRGDFTPVFRGGFH